ncbi:hypothetical protein NM688_g907 [Phlebia brevispora]|uniref:Uncharacterized protein n=1 Tax=Phlebia brevispora TaxID=194682 RepID=A0ACC1TCN4_9APHY|nr:hypothetical protein NM688_g907 [Phlebia brevispora]
MRYSTTVIALALAAAAASPAFAAPFQPLYRPYRLPSTLTKPRIGIVTSAPNARSFSQDASDFAQGFEKGFVGTLETVGPIAASFLKREEAPRSFASDFASGFEKGFVGTLETVGPIAASFLKREDVPRSFGSEFEQGFVDTLQTLGPVVADFLKREAHGARDLGSTFDLLAREPLVYYKFPKGVKGLNGGVKTRSFDELD